MYKSICSALSKSASEVSSLKQPWMIVFLGASVLAIINLMPTAVLADTVGSTEIEREYALLASLESANIILGIIAAAFFIGLAWQSGASRQRVGVGYLACGFALLTVTRIFYIIADRGFISVHEDTLGMWWHAIFILAMVSCIFGGKVLSDVESERDQTRLHGLLILWSASVAMLAVAAFVTIEWLDQPFLSIFRGTIWAAFGIQHFAALVFAAVALLLISVSLEGN